MASNPLPTAQSPYHPDGHLEDLIMKHARDYAEDWSINRHGFEAPYYSVYNRFFQFLQAAAITTASREDPPHVRFVVGLMPQLRLTLKPLARIPDFVLIYHNRYHRMEQTGQNALRIRHEHLVLFEAKPLPLPREAALRRASLAQIPRGPGRWREAQLQVIEQAAVHFGKSPAAGKQVIAVVSVGRWWKWTVLSSRAINPLSLRIHQSSRVERWLKLSASRIQGRYRAPGGRVTNWSPAYQLGDDIANPRHAQGYDRLLAEVNRQVARHQPPA